MRVPSMALLKIFALAIIAVAALLWFSPQTPDVQAGGGPGTNCASYAGGVCEIAVGDIWFCDDFFSEGVCTTTIETGDSVRWNFPASDFFGHTTTECGGDCGRKRASSPISSRSTRPASISTTARCTRSSTAGSSSSRRPS